MKHDAAHLLIVSIEVGVVIIYTHLNVDNACHFGIAHRVSEVHVNALGKTRKQQTNLRNLACQLVSARALMGTRVDQDKHGPKYFFYLERGLGSVGPDGAYNEVRVTTRIAQH